MGEEQTAPSGHCPPNVPNYGHIIRDGGIFPLVFRHPIYLVLWTVHYISFYCKVVGPPMVSLP